MTDPPWKVEATKRYFASLPAKVENLRALLAAVREAPADDSARENLRNALHKIHGSAGSYGCDDLGMLAGACEALLIAAGGTGCVSAEVLGTIEAHFGSFCARVADLTDVET